MTNFEKVIAQEQALELLNSAITLKRFAQVYLFVGPSGVGRRLTATIFSQILLGLEQPATEQEKIKKQVLEKNHEDLLWVEPTYTHQGKILTAQEAIEAGLKRKAPPQLRLEQIREITNFLGNRPVKSSRFVVIIEDVESMNESAVNGLLKTLEDPKPATIILIAKSIESILPTLVSRCQQIPFYRLTQANMELVLKDYPEVLNPEIISMAEGSPGEAIALAAQLESISLELRNSLKQVIKNPLLALEVAKEIDKNLDTETQLFLIDYLQHWYWDKQRDQNKVTLLEKTREYLLGYVQPRLVWECTLLKLCQGA